MNPDDRRRPLFMISVAAELAEMHPQTLRMYERRGLIMPNRSSKQTRLYSMEDVDRLRYIQRLTGEGGLNLAGVERVLELETAMEELESRVRQLRGEIEALAAEARQEVEQVHRSHRRELVLVPAREVVIRAAAMRRR
jgi:MerR family transcriptional regulator, heat shock protein HspR